MNKNKSLQVIKKQNIFSKIINFFKNSFIKEENIKDELKDNINNNVSVNNKNSFKNELKEIVDERARLLEIQKGIKMGKVKEKDLQARDIIALKKIYKEQIFQIKKSVKNYNHKILSIKRRIAQNG